MAITGHGGQQHSHQSQPRSGLRPDFKHEVDPRTRKSWQKPRIRSAHAEYGYHTQNSGSRNKVRVCVVPAPGAQLPPKPPEVAELFTFAVDIEGLIVHTSQHWRLCYALAAQQTSCHPCLHLSATHPSLQGRETLLKLWQMAAVRLVAVPQVVQHGHSMCKMSHIGGSCTLEDVCQRWLYHQVLILLLAHHSCRSGILN